MILQEAISEFAREIAVRYQPEKIVLFGSQANGHSTRDSDVDLLIMMDYEGLAPHKAAEIVSSINPNFPVDLFVRSKQEVEERLHLNDYFFRDILLGGVVLYEAAHS
jgi:predicted nucleotidyltransferase